MDSAGSSRFSSPVAATFNRRQHVYSDFGDLALCHLQAGSQVGTWTLTAAQADFLNGAPVWLLLEDASFVLGTDFLPPYVN